MKKVSIDTTKIKIALYSSILFSGLNESLINKIAKLVNCYLVKKKEKVIIEKQRGRDIFIIISGKIDVYFKSNKKLFLVKRLITGDIFGEIGFFVKQRTANCEAYEDTIIGVINYKNFSKLVFQNRHLICNLIKTLISRILDTDKEIKNLAFKPVLQRVSNVILTETIHKNTMLLNIQRMSQKTAAARETVSRMISMLEKAGIVKRQKELLIVLNRQKLKEIAK